MEWHARFADIVGYLETERNQLETHVRALSSALADQKPDEASWSPVELIEHLVLVEGFVANILQGLVASAPPEALGPETVSDSLLGSLDGYGIVAAKTKRPAPEMVCPKATRSLDAAWAALVETRTRVMDALRKANGLAVGQLTAPHPVLGPINFYQWAVFSGQHEERHIAQFARTVERLQSRFQSA
jgi:hypothetical protein